MTTPYLSSARKAERMGVHFFASNTAGTSWDNWNKKYMSIRNNMMGNLTGNPKPKRGKNCVQSSICPAQFCLSWCICFRPTAWTSGLPGHHSPPGWHSWWRVSWQPFRSQQPVFPDSILFSDFQFERFSKLPMYFFSDLPRLKNYWNVSRLVGFVIQRKLFSTCISYILMRKNPRIQTSLLSTLYNCPWRDLISAYQLLVCFPAPFH